MVWRRIELAETTTLAELHYILQICFQWDNYNLHNFRIHGKDVGIPRAGCLGVSASAYDVAITDLAFDEGDKFWYTYNYFEHWIIDIVLTLAKDTNEPQLGLTILESKDLLSRIQEIIVSQQAQAIIHYHQNCPCCGSPRRLHSHQQLVYRTLFGTFTLDSPRVYECHCQPSTTQTTTILGKRLIERTLLSRR